MLRFECDYGEGAAPAVLELMQKTNFDQTPGYGEDSYCAAAADKIRALCDAPDAAVRPRPTLRSSMRPSSPGKVCCAPTAAISMYTRPAQ